MTACGTSATSRGDRPLSAIRMSKIVLQQYQDQSGRAAEIVGGPNLTQTCSRIIRLVVRSEYKRGMPHRWRLVAVRA
jgi:hypothetical protein